MSATIHYNFEACEKSAEQLISLNEKWEANRPKLPEIEGQGAFMDGVRDIIEVLDMLHQSFGTLATDTGIYIRQVATEMKAVDEADKEMLIKE